METPGIGQIFFGKGRAHFGSGFLKEAYPQWWGQIAGKDDTGACQAALDSGAAAIRFQKRLMAIDAVGDAGRWRPRADAASDTKLSFDHALS